MGKKSKVGKQRRDKFYHLAKEAGYRSRAAFKLIQLNKRFQFLQNSRALVDLCAAPGGWLQVASQNMPVSSLCVGIDLVPIKPIKNCITLQGDITTEKARQAIKKELHTWEADCVLHDGAPNVGTNWTHDAFQQNCLVLSALKLATQILARNGVFVTKIFRSNEYQSVIEVFEQLFKKVNVWKPAASRLESSEIFVVCEKYLKPAKVSRELLDPNCVFSASSTSVHAKNPQLMLYTQKSKRKAPAEGYEGDSISLYKVIPASEFLHSTNHLELLSTASKIEIDEKRWEDDEATNEEVLQCLNDIKVCGPRELRMILAWRKKLLKKIDAEAKIDAKEDCDTAAVIEDPDKLEEDKLNEIDRAIQESKARDKAVLKRKKKKQLKEKSKAMKRKKYEPSQENSADIVSSEQELFSLSKVAKAKDLGAIDSIASNAQISSESEDDLSEDEYMGNDSLSEDSDQELEENLHGTTDIAFTEDEKKAKRVSSWFSKDGIANFMDDDDDDDEALTAIEKHMAKTNKVTSATDDMSENNEDIKDSLFESNNKLKAKDDEVLNNQENEKPDESKVTGGSKRVLDPESLALGEKLIYSSKTRSEIEDWSWNRYTNNDEGLPDWFVEDEKKHYRKELPITKEEVLKYKERLKELNARPIKKVADAFARKKRREMLRINKAKKKAQSISENETMDNAEKVKEMKKIYRKAFRKERKEITYQVMTKGKTGRVSKPKGLYKVVDARQKKDNRRAKMDLRKKIWKKMSSSARRAQMEKTLERRRKQKSNRVLKRRMKRGKA
uniref:Putative rRNA methyltransferase n=1 Tax=Syphacia muris TaxID=451379 RepID=A0A0N5AXR9_9BILA